MKRALNILENQYLCFANQREKVKLGEEEKFEPVQAREGKF